MTKEENKTVQFPTKEAPAAEVPTADIKMPTKEVPVDVLINALKCIDAAAARGAYQGGEMSSVGSIRDTLYAIVEAEINAIVEQQKTEKSEDESAEPTND